MSVIRAGSGRPSFRDGNLESRHDPQVDFRKF